MIETVPISNMRTVYFIYCFYNLIINSFIITYYRFISVSFYVHFIFIRSSIFSFIITSKQIKIMQSSSSKNLRVRSSSHNQKSPTRPISPQKKFDHKK
jgi:hypothetical protein